MTWQLANAKVWDGSQWVAAVGGSKPWWESIPQKSVSNSGGSGILVSASATPNVKGAWVQWIASTAANADLLVTTGLVGSNGVDSAGLLDIALGAAGAEVAIASNIAVGGHSGYPVMLPVKIPAGSRISGRFQNVIGTRSYQSYLHVLDTGTYADVPTSVTVMGTDTATSLGTPLTNATFVQVIASTAATYRAVIVMPSVSSATMTSTPVVLDLATGAAGSEVVVGSTTHFNASSEQILPYYVAPNIIPGPFAAGTRLSVRTSTAGGGITDVCLIGIA